MTIWAFYNDPKPPTSHSSTTSHLFIRISGQLFAQQFCQPSITSTTFVALSFNLCQLTFVSHLVRRLSFWFWFVPPSYQRKLDLPFAFCCLMHVLKGRMVNFLLIFWVVRPKSRLLKILGGFVVFCGSIPCLTLIHVIFFFIVPLGRYR